jgi:exodeoxyribonuclease-3
MRIISWNVNGIRWVYKKNFYQWFEDTNVDIVCLKEIKAQETGLSYLFGINLFTPKNYYLYSSVARKKGYSEVAVFTKVKPLVIKYNLGFERFDQEGRILFLEYPNFTLINVYIPHGGRMKQNLQYKSSLTVDFWNISESFKTKK